VRAPARVAARWASGDLWRTGAVWGTSLLLLYLVAVPLLFLLYGSLSTGLPGQAGTLSVQKYVDVLSDPRNYRIMTTSVVYAAGSSIISFVIGAAIAWLVLRTNLPAKGLFVFITLFPLFMPTVLISMGWILLLDANVGMVNRMAQAALGVTFAPFDVHSLLGMIWVRGVMDVPLIFLWLWPAFEAMDPSLEEAAAMSRAGPLRVLRTITLPLVLPALAAAFLISFVASIEDVTVPIFIGLPAGVNVFASEIYLASTRVPSDIHAASVYAVILLLITLLLTIWYRRITYHTERYVIVRGRGYRPSLTPLGRWRGPLAAALALALTFIVGLPIFVLLWTSLSRYLQVPSIEGLRNLSFRWYEALLVDPMVLRGFVNSTVLGIGTGVAVMLLAVIVGWIVVRSRGRVRDPLDVLAVLPIALPGLGSGRGLLWL
jgi:iron(III) transport system permease protein